MSDPRVSVLVRSKDRPAALAELLTLLLAQNHDAFEIVIVEQTQRMSREQAATLDPLFGDPRARVLRRRPLGGAAARNVGMGASRGDIVVMIDDDDLPLSDDWITRHERHYEDPDLVGLSARQVWRRDEVCPHGQLARPLLRRMLQRYDPLGVPFPNFPRLDEDVSPVQWIHGTNGSIRRESALRAGLWDTDVRVNDEHSLAFKLARTMRRGEYLAFKAEPAILRRLDVAGGLDKRRVGVITAFRRELEFSHRVVRRYHPGLFHLAYPLYVVSAAARCVARSWGPERAYATPSRP